VAMIKPVLRVLVPRPEHEQAELRRAAEEAAAARETARLAQRPARLAALASGPTLRDIEGAANCHCGCHPSAASVELHDGGATCPCQQTIEERRKLWDDWASLTPDDDELSHRQHRRDAFDAAVESLGVEAEIAVEMCPLVITGVVDRRAFYLRERHDIYRVTIACAESPLDDPWRSPPEVRTIDIAEGSAGEFVSDESAEIAALRIAVDAVRSYLRVDTCTHEVPTDDEHRFCRRCGSSLSGVTS
jgi:hypothetical protein